MSDKNGDGTEIDMSVDSVRSFTNGERVKVMVIMDATVFTPEELKTFMSRCLASLTRMGEKVMKK